MTISRAGLFLACAAALLAVNVYYFATMPSVPRETTREFLQEPCDRPVLVTRQQVWDATFGSEYPREYVEYSAWWVRLE